MQDIKIENEIVMRDISTVKPYARNPRRNSKTVELLTKLIPKVGFNVPIVIDENGIIVKGHARFTAAIRLGMEQVPCITTHADEEAIKADRIADNKISEFSEWVNSDLMNEINEMNFDLSDLGLPKIDFGGIPSTTSVKEELSTVSSPTPSVGGTNGPAFDVNSVIQGMSESGGGSSVIDSFGDVPYYRCVCEKCGLVMFLTESEIL